jgi:hypothetical protein
MPRILGAKERHRTEEAGLAEIRFTISMAKVLDSGLKQEEIGR